MVGPEAPLWNRENSYVGKTRGCFACAAACQRTEGPEQGLASAREGAQAQRQNTPGPPHDLCGRMLAVNDTICNAAVVRISQDVLSPSCSASEG